MLQDLERQPANHVYLHNLLHTDTPYTYAVCDSAGRNGFSLFVSREGAAENSRVGTHPSAQDGLSL